MYIARPRRRCATEVPAPGAPIDNRWNKKLEFVYSLVTQIRAAARHPRPTLSKPSPAGRTLATTTAADISDQHESAFPLPTALSATTSTTIVGERTSSRTTLCAVPTPAESRAALPKRQRQLHRQTTYTQSPSPTRRPYTPPPLVSLYFSPLFPARAPFRSVRRVCRTTCPSWPRMHLSNGETNW